MKKYDVDGVVERKRRSKICGGEAEAAAHGIHGTYLPYAAFLMLLFLPHWCIIYVQGDYSDPAATVEGGVRS